MSDLDKRAAERRVNERIGVVAPVELRVWDAQGKRSLSETMHAVVTDASRGGLRAELIGPVAHLFAENSFADVQVTISFLVASLHDIGPIPCALRWSRPTPGGHSIGLQLVRDVEVMEERVLRELQYGAVAGTGWRSGLRVGLMGAAVMAIVGLGVATWDAAQREDSLRAQLAQATEGLQQAQLESHNLTRTLADVRGREQALRDQVAGYQAQQAADDKDTQEEVHTAETAQPPTAEQTP